MTFLDIARKLGATFRVSNRDDRDLAAEGRALARESAFAQGSVHPVYPEVTWGPWLDRERLPWDFYVEKHTVVEHEIFDAETFTESHPVLAIALQGGPGAPTRQVKIEWLKPEPWDRELHADREIDFNYTQIVRVARRVPQDMSEEDVKAELLGELFDAMEAVLTWGVREFDASTYRSYCGGTYDLLGRMPVIGDTFKIRFLAGRELIERRTEYSSGVVVIEWLTEFTLEAHAQ